MFNIRYRLPDQQGNESMQTVLIMAVGALVLLGVNRLYREISPTIRQYVHAAVSGQQTSVDSDAGGFAFGGEAPSHTSTPPNTFVPSIEVKRRDELPNADQHPVDIGSNNQSDLRRAETMVYEAIRRDRLAEVEHLKGNAENENRLRAEAAELKLAAARIRGGDQEAGNTQKQIDAANAMRDLWDLADKGSGLLPPSIDKFYQWAKIPVRDGLPQITEVTVGLEQQFHGWLAAQVAGK